MEKVEFKIEGMTCGGCAKGVRGAILNVDGVNNVSVDFDTKTAKVEFDEASQTDKVSEGLEIVSEKNSLKKTCEMHIFKAVEAMNYKVVKSD